MEAMELQAQGVKEEILRSPSISSDLFDLDIALPLRVVTVTQEGSKSAHEEVEERVDEEMVAQKVFQPAFDAYFEIIFKAVENQIKEALAKKLVLEKLKMGLIHNMDGKSITATRETV
ncbi:hypothetical protein DM860_004575 [Cuscuta australis]|uniref:Uncharacterized protein n=1 Tax=Cuscuta australis TaxID=267555 RepID=A0A328E7X7_9ASTE|nr:hypothetical protein DM860_004575 [Cuscuta australis]